MNCPNCGAAAADSAAVCVSCGIIFAKWKLKSPPSPAGASSADYRPWVAAAALALLLFALRDKLRGAFFILDGVDLVIHEAGHPILGLFGWRWLMMAGGTIFQLAFPIAFAVHFYRDRKFRSGDVCVAWVGQNLLNIGRYAADARAQELPLVGGGEHDWTYLLECWGLLTHDIGVGRFFDFLGCALIAWAAVEIVRRTREISRA